MGRERLSNRQLERLARQLELILQYYTPADTFTVLDLGTEYGLTAQYIKKRFPHAEIHGVEIHQQTFDECQKESGQYYSFMMRMDAIQFLQQGHQFDVIIAAELIEHLEKDQGVLLLGLMKAQAKLAIVTSPLGFMHQGPLYENPYQVHKCGWDLDEFNIRGWKVNYTSKKYHLGVYYNWKKS